MTQNERLKIWLKSGKKISPLTAWKDLGIYRLAARISDIQDQVEIKRGWLTVANQYGEKVKVREYWV